MFSRIALFHMKTRVCLIYFVHNCLLKQFFASDSPQAPSNSIFWTTLVTLRFSTQFQLKIRATKFQKVLNFVLLDNYFTDLSTEVEIRYQKTFKFAPRSFLER